MRIGFLLLALIIVVFAGAHGGLGSATRTAFAQSSQSRNQTQPQEGLPVEKKRNLSRIGPEDIIPMTSDNRGGENNSTRTTRPQRKTTPTSTFPPTPPQRAPATPAPAPPATSSVSTSSAAQIQPPLDTPSPAIGAAATDSAVQSPLSEDDSSVRGVARWRAYALVAMALIVSAALIFTLTKLVEKIRESNAG